MILRAFPRTDAPQSRTTGTAAFGQENVVTLAQTRHVSFGEHTAPLSVKATVQGVEHYRIEGRHTAADPHTYLLVNAGQPYASTIEAEEPVTSFCVFFRAGLAAEALATLLCPEDHLLDDPYPTTQPLTFFQHRHAHDATVTPRLRRLYQRIAAYKADDAWVEEQCHALLHDLLVKHRQIRRRVLALPALRVATRVEVYRRLHRAKDYLDTCFAEPLALSDLAQVACFSEHHFLRLFKAAFGQTPYQYLIARRLEAAQDLLMHSRQSITEVCLHVGYHDVSSFGRRFRQRFGVAPHVYRQQPHPAKTAIFA